MSVVDRALWDANLSAYTAFTEPLQTAVEVVSTNWEDDYIDKLDEYQRLGIPEFWIVDYLAMGSRDLLGKPKVPTVFIADIPHFQLAHSIFKRSNEVSRDTNQK